MGSRGSRRQIDDRSRGLTEAGEELRDLIRKDER